MTDDRRFSQAYWRGGLRAWISCSPAGCGVEIVQPGDSPRRCCHLELLLQPTDDRGWPQGRVRCLHETDIPLSVDCWSSYARGSHRLPFQLSSELLRQCHLRLTCYTLSPTAGQ